MRVFKTTPAFRKAFGKLGRAERELAREKFKIFKKDPFDPSLGAHRINRLSAVYRRTVHAVRLAGDLRVVFYIDGNDVVSIDIGTHAIYDR